MNKTLKWITLAVLMCTVTVSSTASASNLDDALAGMFESNSTKPASFSNQMMGGLSGGGIAVRIPVTGANVISFDPPRISAGCGGIDLFGGSFSFINAQQLVALFRQIAANAVGVAFKAAIDAINPALGKLMQDFQNKIQQLNSMLKNSCGLATSLMNESGASGAIRDFVSQETAGDTGAISGAMDDVFSGIDSFLSSPNALTRTMQQSGQEPELGNLTWMALLQSNAGVMLGNPATGVNDQYGADEILMSLVGTVVTAPQSNTDTQNSQGQTQVDTGHTYIQQLTIDQLREGDDNGQNPINQYSCQGSYDQDGCMNPIPVQLPFMGVKGYVNNMLFGTVDASSIDASSIVGLMDNCTTGGDGTGCNFTQSQQTFIASISQPVLGLMKKVQSIPGAADNLAFDLAPIIVDELTLRYGMAALTAAEAAYSGGSYTMDKTVAENIKVLQAQMNTLRVTNAGDVDKLNAAIAYAKAIAADNPALFVKPISHAKKGA